MSRALTCLLLLVAPLVGGPPRTVWCRALQAEVKTQANCTIEGLVVKASTGEPLKKAVVTLWKPEAGRGPQKNATTDGPGRFVIKEIDAGRYHLWAVRNGYVRQEYGARDPEFLRRYEDRGQAVHPQESGAVTLQVPLIPSEKGLP